MAGAQQWLVTRIDHNDALTVRCAVTGASASSGCASPALFSSISPLWWSSSSPPSPSTVSQLSACNPGIISLSWFPVVCSHVRQWEYLQWHHHHPHHVTSLLPCCSHAPCVPCCSITSIVLLVEQCAVLCYIRMPHALLLNVPHICASQVPSKPARKAADELLPLLAQPILPAATCLDSNCCSACFLTRVPRFRKQNHACDSRSLDCESDVF
jgi:hypothetical protein